MKYFVFVLCLLFGAGLLWHLKVPKGASKGASEEFSDFDFFLKDTVDTEDNLLYKDLYQKNYKLFREGSVSELKIPKVIHFVWIGAQPFPIDSLTLLKSWRRNHPAWKIYFWTDDVLRPLPIDTLERRLIAELGPLQNLTFSSMKDKMRLIGLEILAKEGGVFVDDTLECYQPFDPLNLSYDFYVGLSSDQEKLFPCSKLIAAKMGHPILLKTLSDVKASNDLKSSFTTAVSSLIDKEGGINIAFPTAYFYPSAVFDSKKLKELKKEQLFFASGPTCSLHKGSMIKKSIGQLFLWSFINAICCFGLLLAIFIKKRAL